MGKIKTKEVYIKSVKHIRKIAYHTARRVNPERNESKLQDATPEGYATTDIEKQSQKTAYYTGRWLKNQGVKIKKKQTVTKASKSIKRKKQMARIARLSLQKSIWLTKQTSKAVVGFAKAVVTATKAIIAFIIEGGWIPLDVILSVLLIICMVLSLGTIFSDNKDASDSDMQMVAYLQIGNVGGVPYWSWYGYSNRVEW